MRDHRYAANYCYIYTRNKMKLARLSTTRHRLLRRADLPLTILFGLSLSSEDGRAMPIPRQAMAAQPSTTIRLQLRMNSTLHETAQHSREAATPDSS